MPIEFHTYEEHAVNEATVQALKRGCEEGREEGREEGIQEGFEKGLRAQTINVAMKMLAAGKNDDEILSITGISQEDLNFLKVDL